MLAQFAIAGATAGAGWLAYHCYAPASQLYGATITNCHERTDLALTYDDGPNDPHTLYLLDVLARHEVKATFFLIGKFVRARPEIARTIVQAGHLVANHTATHPNLLFLSRRKIAQQISDCSKAIADVTGVKPQFFRPPFGARRPAVFRLVRELGLTPVMWNVTCFDWKNIAVDRIERHAEARIDGHPSLGPIILLHDGGHKGMGVDRSRSVEASERLIRRYKDRFRFRRIDEIEPRS